MYNLNRYALILHPKKPLLDWVNYIFPDSSEVESWNPLENDRTTVYLIPQFDYPGDAVEWVKLNFDYFFELNFEDWCTDEELWPKNRSWELFQEWFEISVQSCVSDVLDDPIKKEEI